MKRLILLAGILLLTACSGGDDNGTAMIKKPKLIDAATSCVTCSDLRGSGPDIQLCEPPSISRQLKDLDGCQRNGFCFYNCGKE